MLYHIICLPEVHGQRGAGGGRVGCYHPPLPRLMMWGLLFRPAD